MRAWERENVRKAIAQTALQNGEGNMPDDLPWDLAQENEISQTLEGF